MENTTKKTWQEELQETIDKLPEDQKQRAHDFLVGYVAALKEEKKAAS